MGDFCDVAEPLRPSTVATAEWLSRNDPALTRDLIEHNEYGARACNWKTEGG